MLSFASPSRKPEKGEAMSMKATTYLVQCLKGHVYEAEAGTELERRCQGREARGFIDALCIAASECPACLDDAREAGRMLSNLCGLVGCAYGGCKTFCKLNPHVAESPLENQIGRMARMT